MAIYNVHAESIDRIVTQTLKDVSGNFGSMEIVLAMAEVMGRVIVDVSANPVQGREAVDAAMGHLGKVLDLGFKAKGY